MYYYFSCLLLKIGLEAIFIRGVAKENEGETCTKFCPQEIALNRLMESVNMQGLVYFH